jgi:hypothetical protein
MFRPQSNILPFSAMNPMENAAAQISSNLIEACTPATLPMQFSQISTHATVIQSDEIR